MVSLLKKLVNVIEPQKFDINRYGRKHTPDILTLQQYKRHLVFIPCNLQKGKKYHHFLKDAKPYGLGYTRRKFQVYHKNLGNESFPIPLPGLADKKYVAPLNNVRPPASLQIRGELYFCDADTISAIDNYKLNGVEFNREVVEIKYIFQEPITQIDRDTGVPYASYTGEQVYMLAAHMYVGVEEYWAEQLDAGYVFSACAAFKPRSKTVRDPFYEFR